MSTEPTPPSQIPGTSPGSGHDRDHAIPANWFEASFGGEYMRIYRRRDEIQARQEVAFVAEQLQLVSAEPVLDLCCGAGRHLKWLRRLGVSAIGLDLSPALLGRAAERLSGDEPAAPPLVRADMRYLPFAQEFSAVVSFFSSFGYFADERDDARTVDGIARVLRPGGRFSVDLMDRETVVRNLVPKSAREEGAAHIDEERWISADGRRVEKRTTVTRAGAQQQFHESVRMYSRDEAVALFQDAGLSVERTHGDFLGTAHRAGETPRMILVGRRCA